MKKLLIVMMTALLVVSLFGCKDTSSANNESFHEADFEDIYCDMSAEEAVTENTHIRFINQMMVLWKKCFTMLPGIRQVGKFYIPMEEQNRGFLMLTESMSDRWTNL